MKIFPIIWAIVTLTFYGFIAVTIITTIYNQQWLKGIFFLILFSICTRQPNASR